MAPRPSVPLREIVYTLSPYSQEIVMQGIAKLPGKITKYFYRNASGLAIFSVMLLGPMTYAKSYVEREKIESRY